jgi:16S rRNA (guanine1516-N2)-methyltransferase
LLRDGLATREAEARGHVELVRADARRWLAGLAEADRPDVVFLDPMYPEKKKALAKREMQMLQQLLGGPASDDAELLEIARSIARRRVVVKRPPQAPPLAPAPHHVLETKLVRFDVYEAGAGSGTGAGRGSA